MEELFDGAKAFNRSDFLAHRELFKGLGKRQAPHTLFIGCSDSRLVPNMITQTLPGELFVVRNIANIVPPCRETGEYVATTSAIEYAVQVLGVRNILVCGHSNCGGCNALWLPAERLAAIPHTRKWLELARRAKDKVERELGPAGEPAQREWMTEQYNIIEQMNHLVTYPYIKELYKRGEMKILGWHYIIETGEIYNYSVADRGFRRIE